MINVTKTYLPQIDKYKRYIDEIYSSGQITNSGPLVNKLEKRLERYLGVKNIVLVANGTVALEVAYRALNLSKEVITSPFSFVATTSSIVSCGLEPVFVDIDKDTFNINTKLIRQSISEKTSGIVPVHVFGNPCDVFSIKKIADEYNLKIVYDAAHAFGIRSNENNLLSFGDISTLSFHATKIFHTIEGGALIVNDDKLVEDVRSIINFGIKEKVIPLLGTNAKMNDFEAAMGLCMLDDIESIIAERNKKIDYYFQALNGKFILQKRNLTYTNNGSYFPILFENEEKLVKYQKAFNEIDIFPRRYFTPSLDSLPYLKNSKKCSQSRNISKRILCLPLYKELTKLEQDKIIDVLLKEV